MPVVRSFQSLSVDLCIMTFRVLIFSDTEQPVLLLCMRLALKTIEQLEYMGEVAPIKLCEDSLNDNDRNVRPLEMFLPGEYILNLRAP